MKIENSLCTNIKKFLCENCWNQLLVVDKKIFSLLKIRNNSLFFVSIIYSCEEKNESFRVTSNLNDIFVENLRLRNSIVDYLWNEEKMPIYCQWLSEKKKAFQFLFYFIEVEDSILFEKNEKKENQFDFKLKIGFDLRNNFLVGGIFFFSRNITKRNLPVMKNKEKTLVFSWICTFFGIKTAIILRFRNELWLSHLCSWSEYFSLFFRRSQR